uniref:Uncharacterized protein n=1 Tax=Picea glauca TaxID=3330 RepID=A0A101LWB1_PICGL|nr:hypothetical protein ABT39_MTgene1666 [Picea glauca]
MCSRASGYYSKAPGTNNTDTHEPSNLAFSHLHHGDMVCETDRDLAKTD